DLLLPPAGNIPLNALTEAFGQGIVSLGSCSSIRTDEAPELEAAEPLLDRIGESLLPLVMKQEVVRKLRRRGSHESDNLKVLTWAETLMRLPLGKLVLPPDIETISEQFPAARQKLDSVCHGQEQAKEALLERHFQWLVDPMGQQRPLALVGPPGCGKTTLLLKGCQEAMHRPVRLFALGAATDASSLVGHAFTYEGSQPGFIVDTLIETQCMNPIFVLDELDKVSTTNRGEEVLRCLLQLTDPLQTRFFRDRYCGTLLPLDLSASLLLFSMNGTEGMVPALLDRLEIITMAPFTRESLRSVILEHIFPTHLRRMDLETSVAPLTDPSMAAAIDQLTIAAQQHGLRSVDLMLHKACLRAWAHARGCQSATLFRGVSLWSATESGLALLPEGSNRLIQASVSAPLLLTYIV
ncbi:AAA family ATPase, partial [bacterium]|nr:AAA family ATPase [bacterium]